MITSSDGEADTEPHNKKKGVATGIRTVHQVKQQRDHFSVSSSSDESDYGKDDCGNYDKRAKLSHANKKTKTNSVPSWKDCPTAVASNVKRAGEYKRINYDKNNSVKKLKKKTDA